MFSRGLFIIMYEILDKITHHNEKFNVKNFIFDIKLKSADFDITQIIKHIYENNISEFMVNNKNRIGITIQFSSNLISKPLHIEFSNRDNIYDKINSINLRLSSINQSKSFENLTMIKAKFTLILLK